MSILCKTIGHSNHNENKFIELLKNADINYVIDCRSIPYSNKSPQFNKDILHEKLSIHNIKYLFMGIELGGRPASNNYYTDNIVDYVKMAACKLFSDNMKILRLLCKSHNVCLMCSEDLPEKMSQVLIDWQSIAKYWY